MLVDGLRAGLHVPPYKSAGWQPAPEEEKQLAHARKLTAADRQLQWAGPNAWGAEGTVLRSRALWPLWTRALDRDGTVRRMNLEGSIEVVPRAEWPDEVAGFMRTLGRKVKMGTEQRAAKPEDDGDAAAEIEDRVTSDLTTVTWVQEEELSTSGERGEKGKTMREVKIPYFVDGRTIIIPTVRGDCLRIHELKVDGEKSKAAAAAIRAFSEQHRDPDSDSGSIATLVDGLTLGLVNPVTWLEELLP